MIGTAEIYKVLFASSAIKNLVSKTGTGATTKYKIASCVKEPDTWLASDTTISIYQSGPNSLGEVYDVFHTVNCRAPTESKAKELAIEVARELHRVTFHQVFFYCTIEQVLVPADNTDSFNSPVTVRVMGTK